MTSSRGSSQPRDRTQVSRTGGGFFTSWSTREAHLHCGLHIFPAPRMICRCEPGSVKSWLSVLQCFPSHRRQFKAPSTPPSYPSGLISCYSPLQSIQPNWPRSYLGTSQQALVPEKSPLLFLLPRMFFHYKVICLQVFTGKSPSHQGLPGPLNLKFHPIFPLTVLVIVISQQHFFFLDWACVTTQHNVFYLFMLFIAYKLREDRDSFSYLFRSLLLLFP